MQAYREYIQELFDKPVKYVWTQRNLKGSTWIAKFEYEYKNFNVYFVKAGKDNEWETAFSRRMHDLDSFASFKDVKNPFPFFATLAKIFDEFMHTMQPKSLTFSSSAFEKSRVKLYRRFADALAYKYGYNVEETYSGGSIKFKLTELDNTYVDDTFDDLTKEDLQVFDESLDKPLPYFWTEQSKNLWAGYFNVRGKCIKPVELGGFKYEPCAYKMEVEIYKHSQEISWVVEFMLDLGGKKMFKQVDVGINPIEVFATVGKMVDDFIKDVNPKVIMFFADTKEKSRVKLYSRFANGLANKYKMKMDYTVIDQHIKFVLTREGQKPNTTKLTIRKGRK